MSKRSKSSTSSRGDKRGPRPATPSAGAAFGDAGGKRGGKGKPKKAAPWLPDVMTAPTVGRPTNSTPSPSRRRGEASAPPAAGRPAAPPSRGGHVAPPSSPKPGRERGGRGAAPSPASAADPFAAREASRYENPIASREAILALLAEQGQMLTAERIAELIGISDPDRFDALGKRLAAMVRDGQLIVNRRAGYGVAKKLDLIPGVVIANPDGYGFLRADSGGEDLFLSPAQMRTVLHGDRVLASIVGEDSRGRKEGAIVEVLERRAPRIVGKYQEGDGFGLVVPDDRRIHQDLLIPLGRHRGAHHGQIVVAEIVESPTRERPPIGKVLAVLGDRLTASMTVRMAIESHGLPHEWPDAVLREAERVEPEVTEAERAGRVDLRSLPLVTIDGEDARDFDDAVYAEPMKSGFRLVVAIADVSHYVVPDTALDTEAYNRATSCYFPDFVVPMLPESLSNGICSLMPKVDRLAMVCDMKLDHEGVVKGASFYPAVIHSHARLTYTKVWAALEGKSESARQEVADVLPHLGNLYALYKLLARQRQQRGAIDFEGKEFKFRLNPVGEVLAVGAYERNDAHKLIEECMIAANVEAAKYLSKRKLPAGFRVHAPPPASKYEELREFLKEFQLKMPEQPQVKPADFAQLLAKVRKRPDAAMLESTLLRAQSLAVYQAANGGHFGLALSHYAHFTSPIRRYPDLLVHRAIRHAAAGGEATDYAYSNNAMERMTAHCSQCERRADLASRDVDERFKCAWMEKHIGSQFDGVVTGVTSFGLFVELAENRIGGLIHITQLPNDYYHFDARRQLLTGERRGMKFRLGDPVRVLVLRASLEDRKIDFRLVEPERAPKA